MEKNLVKQESASPAELIKVAMDKGSDMDKLEKLLNIQMRWEENEAKKAYNIAMAKFKANPPKIGKDKLNKQYNSKYTSLSNLVNTVNPELSKYDLCASWDISQNGIIKVTCKITHSLGYSEVASMSAPEDKSGAKNAIQQIKSTITYLKAVTFESVIGLASTDANLDDDAQDSTAIEYITDEQMSILLDLIDNKLIDQTKFCSFMKVEEVGQIPRSAFKRAESVLIQAKDNTIKEKTK